MKIYHIATRREYLKDGEQRRKYYKTGELSIDESSGNMYIRMFNNPDVQYFCFDTADDKTTTVIDADTNEELKE